MIRTKCEAKAVSQLPRTEATYLYSALSILAASILTKHTGRGYTCLNPIVYFINLDVICHWVLIDQL